MPHSSVEMGTPEQWVKRVLSNTDPARLKYRLEGIPDCYFCKKRGRSIAVIDHMDMPKEGFLPGGGIERIPVCAQCSFLLADALNTLFRPMAPIARLI